MQPPPRSTWTTASSSTGCSAHATAADIRDLYEAAGNTATPPESEADLGVCSTLAFWTGNDPDRIDQLFRSSGLYRHKWERDDYREKTIHNALVDRPYDPSATQSDKVRPSRDAVGTHPGFPPAADVESAGASLRPDVVGDAGRDAPTRPPPWTLKNPLDRCRGGGVRGRRRGLRGAAPRRRGGTILAAGGSAVWYGDGGAGQDNTRARPGVPPVRRPGLARPDSAAPLLRAVDRERGAAREVPREAAARSWRPGTGRRSTGRLHVLETPWSLFTFADERMRDELVALVRDARDRRRVRRAGRSGSGSRAAAPRRRSRRSSTCSNWCGRARPSACVRADPPREQGRRRSRAPGRARPTRSRMCRHAGTATRRSRGRRRAGRPNSTARRGSSTGATGSVRGRRHAGDDRRGRSRTSCSASCARARQVVERLRRICCRQGDPQARRTRSASRGRPPPQSRHREGNEALPARPGGRPRRRAMNPRTDRERNGRCGAAAIAHDLDHPSLPMAGLWLRVAADALTDTLASREEYVRDESRRPPCR